jgi:hypothetical protein
MQTAEPIYGIMGQEGTRGMNAPTNRAKSPEISQKHSTQNRFLSITTRTKEAYG